MSITRNFKNPHVIAHDETKDGISAWLAIVDENLHLGQKKLRVQQLEIKLNKPYNEKDKLGSAGYLSHFQSWVAELKSMARFVDRAKCPLQ